MPKLAPLRPLRRAGRLFRRLRAAALVAVAAAVLSGAFAAQAQPLVQDLRLQQQADADEIHVIVNEAVDFRAFTLASPYRLVVDLPAAGWQAPQADLQRMAAESAAISAVRHGRFRAGTLRIVFDLARPVAVETVRLESQGGGHAVVLRWRPAAEFRAQRFGDFRAIPIPPPRPAGGGAPLPLPMVVIDPGHGGIDPGAIGRHNTLEKGITLAMGRQLAQALQATGRYRVALTRKDDRFLPLRERTRIARRYDADLFLSLHADSAVSPSARGLSVYTLSDKASDGEAAALARQENKADLIGGLDLSGEQPEVVSILIDLAQRETKNQSVRFANQLVQAMVLRVPLLVRPHRQAGFAVLKAPDIPAALVELGFISHPEEERLLLSAQHRAAIIDGIVAAVDNFFVDRQQASAAGNGRAARLP